MKKLISLVAVLLLTVHLFAVITVTPLWERSRAQSNAAAHVKIDSYTKQKTIAVARDTIFLQDSSVGTIYCYSATTGDYLTSFTSRLSDMNLVADDAGNLVLFGPEGATNLKANVREADGTYTEIDLGAIPSKASYPTIIGDIKTKAYVWIFPTIVSKKDAVVYCFEITNKVVSDIKMVTMKFLNTLTGRAHFVIPISSDLAIVNIHNAFTFFINKGTTYSAIGDLNLFIRFNVPVVNTLLTQNGGDYFVYKGRNYLVQGAVGESGVTYDGAFKIYDVTNPDAVSIVYERTTALGVPATAEPEMMNFQAVVKADGVYIYQNAPLNGMAAYKLADDSPVALVENSASSSCYAEDGVVKVVAAPGKRVELYNLAGQLLTSTTTCQPITSLDAANNHVVIVRIAGEVHKVVL